MMYVYMGPPDTADFLQQAEKLRSAAPGGVTVEKDSHWKDFFKPGPLGIEEFIFPVPVLAPHANYVGGIPSVLVSRDVVASGRLAETLKAAATECKTRQRCIRQELYQDITGNIGSPQLSRDEVSLSAGMRTSVVHYVAGANVLAPAEGTYSAREMETRMYPLGEHSYLSESAYEMPGDTWKHRYWGDNYPRLLEIKDRWDPNRVFGCRHCVGAADGADEMSRPNSPPASMDRGSGTTGKRLMASDTA